MEVQEAGLYHMTFHCYVCHIFYVLNMILTLSPFLFTVQFSVLTLINHSIFYVLVLKAVFKISLQDWYLGSQLRYILMSVSHKMLHQSVAQFSLIRRETFYL